MLLEFQQLEERDARLAARVTQVIGHLLRHQFVHTDDRGSPGLLETLRRPAAVSLVAGYFDVAGYRLVIRESEGWAGLLPDLERMSAPRMRIDETLVLLVLRRLWEEGVQDGDILPRGAILLTLNEATLVANCLAMRRERRSATGGWVRWAGPQTKLRCGRG